MKNRNRRKGRPPKFVQDPNGRPIVGLSYNKANSCYYATYSKPRVYFGTNLADALFKFRQWENKQAIEEPYMEISLPYPPGSEGSKIVRWSECCGDPHVIAAAHAGESALIPENIFLEMARNFILKDTINAARKLGIPELARMEDLPPLEPPLSLDALLEFYINRRKPSKEEVKKMKSSWKEFCRIIQVQTVREISSNTIHNYRDVIWEEYEKQGWANSWLRARFNRVKTLFNYSFKHGRTNKKELKTVLDFCRCLSVPSSVEEDAKPIEREHVHQLLDHCDIKWRAITHVKRASGESSRSIRFNMAEAIYDSLHRQVISPSQLGFLPHPPSPLHNSPTPYKLPPGSQIGNSYISIRQNTLWSVGGWIMITIGSTAVWAI